MKRIRISLVLLLATLAGGFAQNSVSMFTYRGPIFAPFVSRLKAEVNAKKVRLIWADSTSVMGPVYICRSNTLFGSDLQRYLQNSIEVSYGVQTYTDEVPSNGEWYYLIIASDESGHIYDIITPLNNIIKINVDGRQKIIEALAVNIPNLTPRAYDNAPLKAEPYLEAAANAEFSAKWPDYASIQPAAAAIFLSGEGINSLKATPQADSIKISFLAPPEDKNAVLYRSIQPIHRFSDLLTATVVGLNVKSPFIDNATPGVPYYYALIYEDDIEAGNASISPGVNSTLMPTEIVVRGGGASRSIPYNKPVEPYNPAPAASPPAATNGSRPPTTNQPSQPVIRNTGQAPAIIQPPAVSGGGYPPVSVIHKNSELSTIQGTPPSTAQQDNRPSVPQGFGSVRGPLSSSLVVREPRVFNIDLQTVSTSQDDSALAQIVQTSFIRRNWTGAREGFQRFLSVPRNNFIESRARFYLAQSFFFSGDYQLALKEFLAVQSYYPDEVAGWVQSCLGKIADR
jgi:hypothetical protein